MRLFNVALLLLALNGLARFTASGAATPRQIVSLDADWKFQPGDQPDAIAPGYDDHDWQRVEVPHDYVIAGAFDRTNRFAQPAERGAGACGSNLTACSATAGSG